MPGSISHRSLLQPRSLTDALKMLRDEGPLVPMAGCTDLYVSLNFGTLKETRFINLWGLAGLRKIEARGELLSIGALATHSDLIRSPLVRTRLPMLAAAAREVGGVQIQNRGTLGGNVANASPAGRVSATRSPARTPRERSAHMSASAASSNSAYVSAPTAGRSGCAAAARGSQASTSTAGTLARRVHH